MKSASIIFLLLFFVTTTFSQKVIRLKISKEKPELTLIDNNSSIANDGGFNLDNTETTFIINNELDVNSRYVILHNESGQKKSLFTFDFGNKSTSKIDLKKGENSFKINKDGTIEGFDTAKKIALPIVIEVKSQKIGKPIWTDTVKENINIQKTFGDVQNNNGSVKKIAGLTKSLIYDAMTLANYKSSNRSNYLSIINYYFFNDSLVNTLKNVPSQYALKYKNQQNNFLDSFFLKDLKNIIEDNTWDATHIESTGGLFGSGVSLSSIGGLDVTNIADGLAKFLVKRTKQELSIAFFDKLKKTIDGNKDLSTLFPQTAALLGILGDEVYNYQNYIQNLREAFKEDIAALDENLPGIIDNHRYFFDQNKALEVSLRSGCYIAGELKIKAHPGDILANYPAEYLDSFGKINLYKGAIQSIQLLSESLRDTASTDNAPYWVNIKKIRDLVNNKDAFKIYLGLLIQQARKNYDSIFFKEGSASFAEFLNRAGEGNQFDTLYASYKTYVLLFGEKIDAINKMIKEDEIPTSTDSAKVEKYAKYFRSSVGIIEYCTTVGRLPLPGKTTIGKELKIGLDTTLKPYFNIAYAVTDLATDINRRNYSAVINHAVYIYDEIVAKKPAQNASNIQRLNNMEDNIAKVQALEKFNATIIPALQAKESVAFSEDKKIEIAKDTLNKLAAQAASLKDSSQSTLSHLINYGAFMASVATAKNSDDVEAAIEAAALPVGSSRIKRASAFNVALNAYVGLFTGHEWIKGVDDKQVFNIAGVSAPIGIAVSWRLPYTRSLDKIKDKTQGNSISIFASLIDIGAVTSYRFSDMDSVAKLPTIELKDIIAPGLFVSWGIKGLPISLNAGYQLGPLLRDVGSEVNKTVDNYYHRVIISANVDIPLLNLYNRKYKRGDL